MAEKSTIFDAIKSVNDAKEYLDYKRKSIKKIVVSNSKTYQEALNTINKLADQFSRDETIKELLQSVNNEFIEEAFSKEIK